MKKKQIKPQKNKPAPIKVFDYALLAVCLSIVALRATYAESPTIQPLSIDGNFSEALYSLSLSAVLTFCFVLWLVRNVLSGRFSYRRTGMEIGIAVFLIASVIASAVAPDKRTAISSVATLVAPIFMALLLVQLLDSGAKIKFVLAVVAALGLVNAQRSADQFLSSNKATIAEYERDPEAQLRIHGIEPNSFQQFMLEHRIYSEGVAGFFLTRNSAASFLLLASFAAAVVLIDQVRNRTGPYRPTHILASSVAIALLLLNLVATKSKGAFVGLLFAVVVLTIYLRFGNWVRVHRRGLFVACLLLAILSAIAIGYYGSSQGTLPGGNSMLVRWQYWHAAAKMYASHPLTGVGPGAFGDYYMHYKPAAALESVNDPHNFALSILAQYGPLGLLGFLVIILGALWKGLSPEPETVREPIAAFGKPAVLMSFVIALVMLIAKPFLLPLPPDATSEETQAAIAILYLLPSFIFLIGMLITGFGQRTGSKDACSSVAGPLLLAALVGLLIHNLLDFAIFEPGVLTVFWALIACLVAGVCNKQSERPMAGAHVAPILRILSLIGGVVVIIVYLNFVLMPVVRSTALIKQANQALTLNRFDRIHRLLDSASSADPLSPTAATIDARLYIRSFELDQQRNPELLLSAEQSLLRAIARNDVEFKNYERLTDVYVMLSESKLPSEGESWLEKATESASAAVQRYPGCARLRVQLARIAEQQGKTDLAVEQYEKAVEIEDAYRRQFRTIYPDREDVVSRVGEDKYLFAKDRLKALRGE